MTAGLPPSSGLHVLLLPVQGSCPFSPLLMTSFSVSVEAKVNGADLRPGPAALLWAGYLSPWALKGLVVLGTWARRLTAWVTHAHPFSVLALTGSGFYVPRSTAGASLRWLSLLCLKRKSKDLQSSAGVPGQVVVPWRCCGCGYDGESRTGDFSLNRWYGFLKNI